MQHSILMKILINRKNFAIYFKGFDGIENSIFDLAIANPYLFSIEITIIITLLMLPFDLARACFYGCKIKKINRFFDSDLDPIFLYLFLYHV